jgi:hypothetical protein
LFRTEMQQTGDRLDVGLFETHLPSSSSPCTSDTALKDSSQDMPCYDHKVTIQLLPDPLPALRDYHEPFSLICREGRQLVDRSKNVGHAGLSS